MHDIPFLPPAVRGVARNTRWPTLLIRLERLSIAWRTRYAASGEDGCPTGIRYQPLGFAPKPGFSGGFSGNRHFCLKTGDDFYDLNESAQSS
jgi:hypothetical protein